MINQVFYIDEVSDSANENHAGSKARADISQILNSMGLTRLVVRYDRVERLSGNIKSRLLAHIKAVDEWNKGLAPIQKNDCVIVQFPLDNHSIFAKNAFAKLDKRGAHLILLIHDLDFIRFQSSQTTSQISRIRINAEELSLLKLASIIIVHNERMKKMLIESCNIPEDKIVSLNIFDYLLPTNTPTANVQGPSAAVVIAGNLQREKTGYVYALPINTEFRLYGPNYEGADSDTVLYCGQAKAEKLPAKLQGSFGLVWDGSSAQSCKGPYGEYLRVNNPHKTSLYIASGLPVIIWNQAALAPFILENELGIAVSSLEDIEEKTKSLSSEQYERIVQKVLALSKELREGQFTKRAIHTALAKLQKRS